MPKIINEDKLRDRPEVTLDETAKCWKCYEPLKAPNWQLITTEDLDVIELEKTIFTLEIVQRCEFCQHLNRMIYANNLGDETWMGTEKIEE